MHFPKTISDLEDRHLTFKPTDIDPKGPAGPLGGKNVSKKPSHARKSANKKSSEIVTDLQNEAIIGKIVLGHLQDDKDFNVVTKATPKNINVRKTSDTSASKAKKVKVPMMKKFVSKIGNDLNGKGYENFQQTH